MNLALRLFAGVIDLLQFIFFITLLAFQFITPVGGGISGAAAGAYLCYNASSGVLEGIMSAIACAAGGGLAGGFLSAFALPVGIAIDIAISCTFGVLLILALWVTGRFSFIAVAMGFSSEMLPGVNAFVPGWSILVHRCIQDYTLKQSGVGLAKRSILSIIGGAAKIVPGAGTALTLTKTLSTASRGSSAILPQQSRGRVPLQTKNFDGIRPANDNRPQRYAQVA